MYARVKINQYEAVPGKKQEFQ